MSGTKLRDFFLIFLINLLMIVPSFCSDKRMEEQLSYSDSVQTHFLKLLQNPKEDRTEWIEKANELIVNGAQLDLVGETKEHFLKLAYVTSMLKSLKLKSDENLNSFVKEFIWGFLSASEIRNTDNSVKSLALKTINITIEQFESSIQDLEQYLKSSTNIELASRLEFPLSSLASLTRELKLREKELDKNGLFGYRAKDQILFKDETYRDLWGKHRSCLNTLYKSKDSLSILLNSDDFNISPYQEAKENPKVRVQTPKYSPTDLAIKIAKERAGGTLSKKTATRNLGSTIRKNLEMFLNKVRKAKENLIIQRGKLAQISKSSWSNYDQEEKELIYEALARSPKFLGHIGASFDQELLQKILGEVDQYYQNKRNEFSKQILITSVMAITAALVPGPTVLILGSRAIKIGQILYAGLIATQFKIAYDYLNDFSSESSIASVQKLLEVENPFYTEQDDMINSALWEGGLTAAFIGLGEVLGFFRVGEHAVSKYLNKFIKWGHTKSSWVLARKNSTTEIKLYMRQLMLYSLKGGKGVLQAPKVLQSSQSHKRAIELIRALEKDFTFQEQLTKFINEIPGKQNKAMFLDAVIEDIFRLADIASKSFYTSSGFIQTIIKETERLKNLALSVDNIYKEFHSKLTITNPSKFHKLANEFIKGKMENPNDPMLQNAADFLLTSLQKIFTFKLGKDAQREFTNEYMAAQIRHQISPLALKYGAEAKQISLKILNDVLNEEKITRELFKLQKFEKLDGYSMKQFEFYYIKMVILIEQIAVHYSQIVSQGAINLTDKIKNQIIKSLQRINNDFSGFFVDMMELNSILTKTFLALRMYEEADKIEENPNIMAKSVLNCRIIPEKRRAIKPKHI